MALFRSERGIGRGEVAESQIEVPMFAACMLLCSVCLVFQHLILANDSLTLALAVSLVVFGGTVLKVEVGLFVLLAAMMLSPEIELAEGSNVLRSVTVRYGDLLIVIIFLGVMVKLTFEGRVRLWQPSPINAAIVTYYGVCILSTLLALERALPAWDRVDAFFVMVKMLEFYLIFFLVAHAVRRSREIRAPLAMLYLVMLAVSIYAIYSIRTTPRVSAPFEHGGTEPNTLGGYLVLCLCVALGLLLQAPRPRQKLLFLAIGITGFIPLLYTLSRASYGALVAGVVVIAVITRNYIIIAAVAGVLLFSAAIMPERVIERVTNTVPDQGGVQLEILGRDLGVSVDKSTYERVHVWRKVGFILSLGAPYFLLGGGVAWESVLDSQYARVLLETGFLGFLAFVFLQWRLLKTAREAYLWTEDWMSRGIALGMLGATIALIVHSIGTISFLIVRIMEPYWFLMALVVSIRNEALAIHWQRHRARKQATPARETPEIGDPVVSAV